MKKPAEQLEDLSKIIISEIQKSISDANWVVKQTNDFQLRLTRKMPPCEGFDIYINVMPEHRYVDNSVVQNIDNKAKDVIIDKLVSGKSSRLEEILKSNEQTFGITVEAQKDILSDPKAMSGLVNKIKENIEKREKENGIE